jgi:hypothetical protein
LEKRRYDFVFVVLPTADTHGQHKAASILALRALEQVPPNQRPAILGAQAGPQNTRNYQPLPGYPITATAASAPQFYFDRDTHFGFKDSLSYQIVVDWAIAEHKSQGLFQTMREQDRFEDYWAFAVNGAAAARKSSALFEAISPRSQSSGSTQASSAR